MILFLLIFAAVPLVELYLLIQVGAQIGALRTIGLTILTAVIGAYLVRMQGFGVLRRLQWAAHRGEALGYELLNGALILLAGLLLLLPGFVTDGVGLLLLVPLLRRFLIAHFRDVIPKPGATGGKPNQPRMIEGDFRHEKD